MCQCVEQPEKLVLCGLDPHGLHCSDCLQDNKKSHLVNVLKAGVVYSNNVIIMSSMQTKGQIIHAVSHGLDPTLNIYKDKLVLARPGFDSSVWDPSVDKFLPQNYSADNMKEKASSIVLVGCIFSDISHIEVENLKTLISMASRRGVQAHDGINLAIIHMLIMFLRSCWFTDIHVCQHFSLHICLGKLTFYYEELQVTMEDIGHTFCFSITKGSQNFENYYHYMSALDTCIILCFPQLIDEPC